MAQSYTAPKGTHDLVGASAAGWDFLQETARTIFSRYGYASIYTPLFENTEVFTRGIGEATDVVGKEMYTFEDRGGRSLTLRPENTAGVVRAAIQANLCVDGASAKLYYAGPQFRYERPQKGRQRQFYQVGAESLGNTSPLADAEMIMMLWDYFLALGLKPRQMTLLVNSMGDETCRPAYRDKVAAYLRLHADKLCEDCVRRADTNPLRAFDCKKESCRVVMDGAPALKDSLCDDCRAHNDAVLSVLDAAGLKYQLDPKLVRGLDYYTRTVFEIQVNEGLGTQNAIGGGGRYDGLFQDLGGKPTPSIGFAVGAERIMLALDAAGIDYAASTQKVIYVAAAAEAQREAALSMAMELRGRGLIALCDLQDRSLKSQFKQADKAGAAFVLIMGEDEVARGGVTIRNMESKEERFVTLGGIVKMLTN
ncbi:MAG: histidine--tRNA ligase [Coriobacteriia bacterium]|nr:histidine--tRNA ligase [Coriobacteriia bacterium]MCL2537248.1 histidine--tRNA ligase [Coriobacteriia bacterium]